MVKLVNLSERTFILKGEVTLAPKGTVEMKEAEEAERLASLYEGELMVEAIEVKSTVKAEKPATTATK